MPVRQLCMLDGRLLEARSRKTGDRYVARWRLDEPHRPGDDVAGRTAADWSTPELAIDNALWLARAYPKGHRLPKP